MFYFAKAFDKLEYYWIRGSTHKCINSWLSGCSQQVTLDGQDSDSVPVLSGMPQGSVLGLVLFLISINDLPLPRFTGKTRITGKTTEIPERPNNNRKILICPSPIKKTIIDY